MNPNILSIDEIIHYVNNGTIEHIDSNAFMRVVEYYEDKLEELSEDKKDSDKAYYDGYDEAVNAMRGALDNL